MAPRKQLVHKQWSYLNPQYDSYTNPVTPHTEPYIVAGSNVLTSRRGYVERMPGSSLYETTATQLNVGKRIFFYKKWSGVAFLIVNEVSSTQSIVYKLKVGSDTAFSSIFTSSSPQPFDFVVANDYLYGSNGTDVQRYDGANIGNWGISSSSGATTTTTGPNSPATAADDGGTSWTNPNNVFTSNDIRATATSTGPPAVGSWQTGYLNVSNFGFAINSGDTINGIKVEIECSSTDSVPSISAVLLRGGVQTGADRSLAITSSEAYKTLGGSTDLWGATLAASDVNLSTFGVAIRCLNDNGNTASGSVDHVRITISSSRGAAPTTAVSGTGITASTGWYYVYCFKNSGSGGISSPSPASASTGAVSNKTVAVTGNRSSDSQVDRVRVFRTTDGGSGIYYFVGEVTNPGSGTWTYNDTTADTALDTSYGNQAPPLLNNDPPIGMYGLKSFASRIWGFNSSTLYYSGWEEINTGLEEESFPSGVTGNFWVAPQEITNLAVLPDKLLVFCRSKVFQVTGDSRSTFSFTPLFENMGCAVKQGKGVAEDGERVFWLNYDNRLWVTNGDSKDLVSESVTDEFILIDPTDFSMVVHRFGEYNWLVVADNNGGTTGAAGATWLVLDLNTGKWMPPWARSANHFSSAELTAGQFTLLYTSYDGATASKTIVRQVDMPPRTRTCQDTSTPYLANAVFALTDIAPPGFVFESEYVGYERDDSGTPTAPAVKIKADEANSAVTWASQTPGTQVALTLRTAGTTLVEKWAYFKQNCRRILVRFEWTNENKNFKLISMDLTGRIIGGDD